MAPLLPWMRFVLRLAGTYNLLAGVGLLVFYHECYKALGIPKPDLILPTQIVGVMVALFGVGYWMVVLSPVENRNVLALGFLSKALGSLLGVIYVLKGQLPLMFLPVLLVADIMYLPPFWIILRRLYRLAAAQRGQHHGANPAADAADRAVVRPATRANPSVATR